MAERKAEENFRREEKHDYKIYRNKKRKRK